MFEDIGKKIKTLAKTICWIGITITVIITMVLLVVGANTYNQTTYILCALLILFIGCLLSWLGSLRLYGFGELIDNTNSIKKKLYNDLIENSSVGETTKTIKINEKLESEKKLDNEIVKSNNMWMCPQCARTNPEIVNECFCGYKKRNVGLPF